MAQDQSISTPVIWTCPTCGLTGPKPRFPSQCRECNRRRELARRQQNRASPEPWTCPVCGWTGKNPGSANRCPPCRKAKRAVWEATQRDLVRQYTCKRCGWSGEIVGLAQCPACARAATKVWQTNNREQQNAYMREYSKRPHARAYFNGIQRQREAAGKNVTQQQERLVWLRAGDVTWQQLREVYLRDGGACVYCGTPVRVVMDAIWGKGFDHVIPKVKGGCHTASNLVVCCRPCNSRKHAHLLSE